MKPRNVQVSNLGFVGVYLLAASMVVWPIVNIFITAWPPHFATPPWRFGFSGLISDAHNTLALGFILAMGTAYFQDNRLLLRVISAIALVGAFFLLLALVLFPLDVLQVSGGAPAEARSNLLAGGLTSELKHFIAFLIFGFLGVGGWRTTNLRLWDHSQPGGGGKSSDLLVKPAPKPASES